MTILNCAFLGESLKLSPSPQLGQYYMVPFNDKDKSGKVKRIVATFQLGYKGYIQLALRSGYYKKLNVVAIKQGEIERYDPIEEEYKFNVIEDETVRENTPTIGYFAMFQYLNGYYKPLYWSKSKMEAHALKYSQGYKSDKRNGTSWTFWSKDFDGMAYKTMLRQLISKWGIMSIEMQEAFTNDMAYRDEKGVPNYVDGEDQPDIPETLPEPVQEIPPAPVNDDDVPDFVKNNQ